MKETGGDMRVGDFRIRDVFHCARETSALELSRLMRTGHVGDVVVVDKPEQLALARVVARERLQQRQSRR